MSLYSALGGAENKTQKLEQALGKLKAQEQKPGPKDSNVFKSSYVLFLLDVMEKIGLGPLDQLMDVQGKLMAVTQKLQADLVRLEQYFTKIEELSQSSGSYLMLAKKTLLLPISAGPNAMNGLSYKEFHEDTSYTGVNNEFVASDLKIATDGFIAAFRDIFCGSPVTSSSKDFASSKFSNFSVDKVDNGQTITQTFSLNDLWNTLNGNKAGFGLISAFSGGKHLAFNDSSNTTASLLQQYAYYKYKYAAVQYKGKIGSLSDLNVTVDPTKANVDGIVKSLFSMLAGFSQNTRVDRYDNACDNNGRFSNTTMSFLDYFLSDSPYAHPGTGTGTPSPAAKGFTLGDTFVDILGAFSYAAFNYFWTKNPQADTDGTDATYPPPPAAPLPDNTAVPEWNGTKGQTGNGDILSLFFSNTQSSSSLVDSVSKEAITTAQQFSSDVSEFQNIGQNCIKANNEALLEMARNFKN